jgi:hypothetical protein
LHLWREGAAESRDRLVAVATVKIDPGAVEEKTATRPELCASNAEADAHDVCGTVFGLQPAFGPVELRVIR